MNSGYVTRCAGGAPLSRSIGGARAEPILRIFEMPGDRTHAGATGFWWTGASDTGTMLLPSHRGDRYDTDGDDMKWKDMDPEEKIKNKK